MARRVVLYCLALVACAGCSHAGVRVSLETKSFTPTDMARESITVSAIGAVALDQEIEAAVRAEYAGVDQFRQSVSERLDACLCAAHLARGKVCTGEDPGGFLTSPQDQPGVHYQIFLDKLTAYNESLHDPGASGTGAGGSYTKVTVASMEVRVVDLASKSVVWAGVITDEARSPANGFSIPFYVKTWPFHPEKLDEALGNLAGRTNALMGGPRRCEGVSPGGLPEGAW